MKKLLVALIFIAWISGSVEAQTKSHANFKRTENVIYGRKAGLDLPLDIFQPEKPNGAGIVYIVSGSWTSSHQSIEASFCQPFLDRGYTVFAVVHRSQPRFTIREILQDVHRALRFIRHESAGYGVDANRLGVIGASSGAHLSLMLGTQGKPGKANAKDPIDRESSAVQCVACYFPPTDFLNYGRSGVDATGVRKMRNFKAAFGPEAETAEGRQKLGRDISPIYYITSNMPPTLIIHGEADQLVPIQQAKSFVQRSKEAGAEAKLIIKEGAVHGWPGCYTDDIKYCADWFDQHLRKSKN